MRIPNPSEIKKITLQKIRFGVSQYVSESMLREFVVDVYTDIQNKTIQTVIKWFIPGRLASTDQETKKYVKTWASWQDAFKDRWFPEFLKRRYPVKRVTSPVIIIHKHYHMCPHLDYPQPRKHLEFLTTLKEEY